VDYLYSGMATRDSVAASHLPLPFDAAEATRLSWDLGDHLTGRAALARTLRRDDSPVRARVYDVAAPTVLVVVETPVGHECHYELPDADVADVIDGATARGFH